MADSIECAWSIEGNGPPLFLIHGIGAAQNIWRFLMPVLAQHFSVVTYDLRGHGASAPAEPAFGLDELVEDLESVRIQTGFEKAHFAGHSLGGMIGPAYARKYPERVMSLGMLSTAAGRTKEDSQKVRAVIASMEKDGISNVLPTLTDRWFTDAFIHAHDDVVDARLKQVMDTNKDIFLNVFRIYAETEMMPWLREISAPALVLTGEHDGGCSPRINTKIAEALPNSELVVLPALKHAILLEAGPLVANHIIEFVRRHDG